MSVVFLRSGTVSLSLALASFGVVSCTKEGDRRYLENVGAPNSTLVIAGEVTSSDRQSEATFISSELSDLAEILAGIKNDDSTRIDVLKVANLVDAIVSRGCPIENTHNDDSSAIIPEEKRVSLDLSSEGVESASVNEIRRQEEPDRVFRSASLKFNYDPKGDEVKSQKLNVNIELNCLQGDDGETRVVGVGACLESLGYRSRMDDRYSYATGGTALVGEGQIPNYGRRVVSVSGGTLKVQLVPLDSRPGIDVEGSNFESVKFAPFARLLEGIIEVAR